MLTYGSGSLPLAGDAIDFGAIENLPAHHPYKKIGRHAIDASAKFFVDIAAQLLTAIASRNSTSTRLHEVSAEFGRVRRSSMAKKLPPTKSAAEKFPVRKKIILAMGGFYSGGIVMRDFDKVISDCGTYRMQIHHGIDIKPVRPIEIFAQAFA